MIETTRFGRTGWEVSRLGLGTYYLTSDRRVAHDEALALIRRAVELGVNIVDTAPLYGRGESEQIVGEALGPADGVRIVDKVGRFESSILARLGDACYRDPAAIRAQFDHSLRLLGRDAVDLLLIHETDWPQWWAGDEGGTAPVLQVLTELRAEGRVGAIGLSVRDPARAVELCELGTFDAMLYVHHCNVAWQEAGTTVLPVAAAQDMGVFIGAPFKQGLLVDPTPARLEALRAERSADAPPGIVARIERLADLARESGIPLVEIGLRWLLANPMVHSVLVGAASVAELEQNVESATRGPLPADVAAAVAEVGAIPLGAWEP